MSEPTTRMENVEASTSSSAKKQKQSHGEDIVFTDREMEYVLVYLAKENLLRAVKSNPRLLPIARRFIQPRYLDAFFKLSNRTNNPESIEFLKLFGMVIKSLKLVYDDDYRRFDQKIEKMIFDYCANSRYVIYLVNANRFSFYEIQHPFESVTEVILETGTICIPFSNIDKWFPKLQTLNLINVQLHSTPDNKIFGNQLFRELEHLEIRNLQSKNGGNFYMKEISVLVKNSPKMSQFIIHDQYNIDELLKTIAEMNFYLPNLRLDLHSSWSIQKPIGTSVIHFKSLKSLDFSRMKSPLNIFIDRIETIHIDCERFDEKWLTLFKNIHKNAHEITVTGEWINHKVASEFVDLVKVLPNLQKMNVMAKLTATQVVDMISKSRSFQNGKFRLKVSGEQPCNPESILDSLQSEWEYCCYSGDIYHIGKTNAQAN